ncbi:MAG: protein-tyrosine phosphatase family protein, partial [Pseudomonadota bacterium]
NHVAAGTESLDDRTRAVEALGMRFTHFPIPDFGTPDLEAATALVRDIVGDLGRGQRLVMHCFAGLGRAGTIAACVLVATGLEAGEAIRQVRSARPGAIQTDGQQRFIAAFADRHRTAP